MADIAIASAASLTGATLAAGDLIPVLDVSAAVGSKASRMTANELRKGIATLGVYSLGTLGATPTPALANGPYQYGLLGENATIQVPSGTPAEGDNITLSLLASGGAWTLDFDAAIKRASDSVAIFPKTLVSGSTYFVGLRYTQGIWCLTSMVGGYV